MTRECHVRFCERLRGQFQRPTHHFGMKAHVGVDSKTKMIHSVVATADTTRRFTSSSKHHRTSIVKLREIFSTT